MIPATGPVSAGGDQGTDFETYPVGKVTAVGTESPFLARATDEKVLFACSIEKHVPAKVCAAKFKPLAVLWFRRKAIVRVGFDAYRVIRPYCKLTKQMKIGPCEQVGVN